MSPSPSPSSSRPSSSNSSSTSLDVEKASQSTLAVEQLSGDAKEIVKVDEVKEEKIVLKTIAAPAEKIPLPPQQGTEWSRWFFHEFLTTYRKTFAIIFFANLAVLIWFCARAHDGTHIPELNDVAIAVSANIMVSILFRQENWVNFVYEVACCVPLWFPLAIRRRLAKVFHYGGMHSGCGTSAVFWQLLYTALATRQVVIAPNAYSKAAVATSWTLCLFFLAIIAHAWPKFRSRRHDDFEKAHRFCGWAALAVFWAHTFAHTAANAHMLGRSYGAELIRQPNFWMLAVSTTCTFINWSMLRKVDVEPEVLSNHVIRLHFKYRTMRPFYGVKIGDSPLTEWHAFATIPDVDETGKCTGFSVVCSNAGDWTNKIINDPPKQLWVRGQPLHGLLYTSRLFKKIVIVATGSGIGPPLSLLHANLTPRRVLWSTPNPLATYGPKVIAAVTEADPEAVIIDTRKAGRPDILGLTIKLVQESGAEAVFIISNPKVTHLVVHGCVTRGIPAYGAIFDS